MHMSRFGAGRSALNNGTAVLSDDTIRRIAPSVFATEKHASRTQRFAYLPTSEILAGLRAEGFQPFAVAQGGSRIPGKAEYTRHMLRLRREENIGSRLAAPEIILLNAHDGTSRYKLMAGMISFVCLNGMITATEEFGSLSISHTGNARDLVIEGSYEVLSDSRLALARAEEWQGITLHRDEALAMAEAAHSLRFEEGSALAEAVRPDMLLTTRHQEQSAPTLWNIANRIQENVIRGGLTGYSADANNVRRRRTTRDVNGIGDNVRLNMALNKLALRMAEIKAA